MLFAVEGALLQLFCAVNGFANNLFATGLGATDLQIGLIQTVPNVAALLLLLPLGILSDRLRSSRTIPLVSLICVAAGYVVMAVVPSLGCCRQHCLGCREGQTPEKAECSSQSLPLNVTATPKTSGPQSPELSP